MVKTVGDVWITLMANGDSKNLPLPISERTNLSGVEDDRTKKLILMCFVLYMFLLFFPQVAGDKIDTTKRLTKTYSCSLFFHVWCCVPKSSGSHRSQNKSRQASTQGAMRWHDCRMWNHRAADTCSRRSGPSRRVTRIHRVKLRWTQRLYHSDI